MTHAATMAAMRSLASRALAFVLVGASGCVQVSDFNPVGEAASISGAWTIDGAFPTTESCQALGASQVRVTFLDGLRPVVHGALIFACASCSEASEAACFSMRECMLGGEVECFDTRPDAVVREGTWTVQLEATSGSTVIAAGPRQVVNASPMGHIALEPVDFLSGRISATFTLNGSAPAFTTCDAAGIAVVELFFESAGGAIEGSGSETCTVGAVGVRVAPGADYTVRLRALAADGTVVGETAPETFTIEPGEHATLAGGHAIELTTL